MASQVVSNINGPRKARAGGRKPLGDLTNLSKPKNLSVLERKSQTSNRKALPEMKGKNSLKPSRVRDLTLDEIAEEMCFHDHQKCVKSQSIEMDQFFKALENELMNDGLTIYSPTKKLKSEIETAHWELEELTEELPAIRSSFRPCTPASSSSSLWDSPSRFSLVLDLEDLKLIDSPI